MASRALPGKQPTADLSAGVLALVRLMARQALREQLSEVPERRNGDATPLVTSHTDATHEPW
jgi:hypothetical protein